MTPKGKALASIVILGMGALLLLFISGCERTQASPVRGTPIVYTLVPPLDGTTGFLTIPRYNGTLASASVLVEWDLKQSRGGEVTSGSGTGNLCYSNPHTSIQWAIPNSQPSGGPQTGQSSGTKDVGYPDVCAIFDAVTIDGTADCGGTSGRQFTTLPKNSSVSWTVGNLASLEGRGNTGIFAFVNPFDVVMPYDTSWSNITWSGDGTFTNCGAGSPTSSSGVTEDGGLSSTVTGVKITVTLDPQ